MQISKGCRLCRKTCTPLIGLACHSQANTHRLNAKPKAHSVTGFVP